GSDNSAETARVGRWPGLRKIDATSFVARRRKLEALSFQEDPLMKTLFAVLLLGLFTLALAPSAESCCMVPATYAGTISQSAQEAVIFHADGREELILKINYKITGDTLPDKFAWVITVPNTPDAYEVADAKLFEEVFPWAEKLVVPQTKNGNTLGGRGDHGLEIGKPVKVGPYTIQPVKALGKEALTGLNQ